jgi:2-oxoglutarate ferredoxin oxidoreductase subunit gamma
MPGGLLIINSSMITTEPTRQDINVKKVPFNEIAKEIGNPRTANMAALGSVLKHFNLISTDSVNKEIEKAFMTKKPEIVDINIKALQAGYDF